MKRGTGAPGFTLTEMLVVVAIIGILAGLAFWTFTDVVPRYRIGLAARDVSNVLVVTRARAIARNRNYIVHFEAASYRVVWDQDRDGVVDAGEPVEVTGTYGEGVSYVPGGGPSPLPGGLVAFDAKGMAFNVTMAGRTIQLTNGPTRFREIQVTYTGTVRALSS